MKLNLYLRRAIFAVLILAAVCFQFSFGKYFAIGSAIPIFVLPLVISTAVFENSLSAILFGLFAGVLTDMFSISEDGFFAIAFTLAAVISSLLVMLKFRRCFATTAIFTAVFSVLVNVAYWFFFIAIKGYESSASLLMPKYIGSAVYTIFFVIIAYPLVNFICKKLPRGTEGEWSLR